MSDAATCDDGSDYFMNTTGHPADTPTIRTPTDQGGGMNTEELQELRECGCSQCCWILIQDAWNNDATAVEICDLIDELIAERKAS